MSQSLYFSSVFSLLVFVNIGSVYVHGLSYYILEFFYMFSSNSVECVGAVYSIKVSCERPVGSAASR